MKTKLPFIKLQHLLLMLFAVSIEHAAFGAPCSTTVLWHNLSDGAGGSSPGVLFNVVDQNIDVEGVNALVEGIHVEARTCDVVITVTNGDAVITGSGNRLDNVITDSARLYLFAGLGRTITFSLQNDLTFRGTANSPATLDLLVTVSGPGIVRFFIEGNEQVSFTSTVSGGGTQVFVGMTSTMPFSTLSFSRFQPLGGFGPAESAQDITVEVGPRSCISFIAATAVATGLATEQGTISFDPSNIGAGNAILKLDQDSCFVIDGHLITAAGGLNSELLLSDIALSIPAGNQARFLIDNINAANNNAAAALQIVNDNQVLTNYLVNPFCDNAFTGTQAGFILGANGLLELNNITYLDYIATATNQVPNPFPPLSALQPQIVDALEDELLSIVQDALKARNPSAFVIDGSADPFSTPATILFHGSSAIYFRSGCDEDGIVLAPSYTINPFDPTVGAGNIVFDIEGQLEVQGDPAGNNALNVLSLQITRSGCPVFVESAETQFPQRTFAVDATGHYLRYNNAAFLINNRVDLFNVCLLHTDTNHHVFERDNLGVSFLHSEPTYIGGEHFRLCLPIIQPRPTIFLYNSIIRFNESAGFTGVDIRVPNVTVNGNLSTFRFYGNGRRLDNAYGRYVILGTSEGADSETGAVLISDDSYLDIFQDTADGAPNTQRLTLDVGSNTTCITQGIVGDITQEFSVHSIWLGHESNISIGTNGPNGVTPGGSPFALTTSPTFLIDGDFFSFVSHGGSRGLPETSGTTGQGGIFVDTNGLITISPFAIANVSTMVVKSRNGVINLPKNQVNFNYRIGITNWNIMLSQPSQRVIIPADQRLADFLLDWGAVTKDYTSTNSFVPFQPSFTPPPCQCQPVTDANLRALPVVQGEVDQFLVKRSRIGDQVHLLCDGGNIRELIFLTGYNTAEYATGFIVVQNNGRVGIGSARANLDSTQGEFVLGINGVTLCANGTGVIEVNDNMIINNVCHIMTGTSFGINGPQQLEIHSDDPAEIRVKSTGLLDLTQFTNPNQIIKFGGQLTLVFEPGSQLVMGGGTLIFTDQTNLSFERILNNNRLVGTQPSDLDQSRVKIIGDGIIMFNEAATMLVHDDTFVGIESSPTSCPRDTDITFIVNDDAKIQIGNDDEPGGVLQVGNTQCIPGANVNFTLIVQGIGAEFQINRRGLFGMGVGIVNKLSQIPNQWLVGCLDNVGTVSIAIQEGLFRHNQMFTGDDPRADLLAVGPAGAYTFFLDPRRSTVLGGGNMTLISGCVTNTCQEPLRMTIEELNRICERNPLIAQALEALLIRSPELSPEEAVDEIQALLKTRAFVDGALSLTPTVTTFSGIISANLTAGMFASKDILLDNAQPPQPVGVTPAALFTYLSVQDNTIYMSPKANIALTELNVTNLGYVRAMQIFRPQYFRILSNSGNQVSSPTSALNRGAVNINLFNDTSGRINNVTEIIGS